MLMRTDEDRESRGVRSTRFEGATAPNSHWR